MCAAVGCKSCHAYTAGDSGSLYAGVMAEFNFYILYISISDFIYTGIKFIHSFMFFTSVIQYLALPQEKQTTTKRGGNYITNILYTNDVNNFLLFFHYIHIIS